MAATFEGKFELVALSDVRLSNHFKAASFAFELLLKFTRVHISRSHHSSKHNNEFTHLLSFYVPNVATNYVLNGRHIYQPHVDVFLNRSHLI